MNTYFRMAPNEHTLILFHTGSTGKSNTEISTKHEFDEGGNAYNIIGH